MSEIVNLRRVRKAKGRAEADVTAEANRLKHGVSKRTRDLAKARADKLNSSTAAHKLDEK